ncbi:SMC-Scp complex subunit ScpB [Roseomonas soli]|uniref:SMC-Scp complex subunit ScpB n=2 Tax=Neoroseomonas soli TaxID=1081025 RepID=A0A9X9X3R5_9PROT|nr:SMC-Scp complex subunit ScpB [Neoroseomonas soli]
MRGPAVATSVDVPADGAEPAAPGTLASAGPDAATPDPAGHDAPAPDIPAEPEPEPEPADPETIAAGTFAAEAAAPATNDGEPDPALLAEGVRIAEALIFASDRPVTPAVLANVLPEGLSAAMVAAALFSACEGRGVVLTEVAGGWAFRTAPDLAQRLTKVVQAPRRLPRAAMEALSVIAYHQPCTRGEIEEIRGASLAQTTLEALLELGLIAPRGRREVPGRPTLWGTTPKFLEQFALKALSDLPRKEELVTAETGPALPLPSLTARPGRPAPPAEPAPAEPAAEAEPDEEPLPPESGDDEPAPPAEPTSAEPAANEEHPPRAAADDAPTSPAADTPSGAAS